MVDAAGEGIRAQGQPQDRGVKAVLGEIGVSPRLTPLPNIARSFFACLEGLGPFVGNRLRFGFSPWDFQGDVRQAK